MNRTIFAMGGGTIGEHRNTYSGWESPLPADREYFDVTTTVIDELILKATGKVRPKVLLILTASEDGKHDLTLFEQAFRAHYEGLGAMVDTLLLVTQNTPIDEVKRKINEADAVYVSGGNTYMMMETWRKMGVDVLLQQAYERGTVMSGLSAGSICWFRYGVSNSFYTGKPFRVDGLNWHNFMVCPHYDQELFRQDALKNELKQLPGTIGLALDEHSAIEIVNDTYRTHITRPGSSVKKCYWKGGEYVVQALPIEEEYQPLEMLMIDI